MTNLLFLLGAALAAFTTLAFAKRSGDRWKLMANDERIGRLGVMLFPAAVFPGMGVRAFQDGPAGTFQWFHALIVLGGVMAVAGYGHFYLAARRRHEPEAVLAEVAQEIDAWLAVVEQLEPCPTEECQRVRARMADFHRRLHQPT